MRAVEDQSPPIPEEITSKLGGQFSGYLHMRVNFPEGRRSPRAREGRSEDAGARGHRPLAQEAGNYFVNRVFEQCSC